MKKIFILLLFITNCFITSAQDLENLSFGTDNTLEIVTWNIENFPKNGQDTIDYVSDIIEALDADLLAIQEVSDISSFNQVLTNLSDYNGYLDSIWFAGLAYIYKPDVIEINDIYEIYTTSEFWSYFPRSPMVMDFDYLGERFIVINNHLKCCGDGFLNIDNVNDEETRRYYANLLLKEYVDTNFPNDNVIILGDLNDNLTDQSTNNVFQAFLNDSENYSFADFEIASGSSDNWSFPNWPSHLDHILITNELFDDLEHTNSDIQTIAIDNYLNQGWIEYDTNVSDHRPVALRLETDANLSITEFNTAQTLFSNYPNPFNTETTLLFNQIESTSNLVVYNLSGQKILEITIPQGQSTYTLNSKELPSGVYMANLVSNKQVIATRKLVVIK